MELSEIEVHVPGLLQRVDGEALRSRVREAPSLTEALLEQIRDQFLPEDDESLSDEESDLRLEFESFLDDVSTSYLDDELLALFGPLDWIMTVNGPEGHWTADYEITWYLLGLPDGSVACVKRDDPDTLDSGQFPVVMVFEPGVPRERMIADVFVSETGDWLDDGAGETVEVDLHGDDYEAALARIRGDGAGDGA